MRFGIEYVNMSLAPQNTLEVGTPPPPPNRPLKYRKIAKFTGKIGNCIVIPLQPNILGAPLNVDIIKNSGNITSNTLNHINLPFVSVYYSKRYC